MTPEVDIEGLGVERLALHARVTESGHATHHARPPLATVRRRSLASASSKRPPPALPPHTLMQRAGLAVARLALALAPHARTIWIACGPGNNGGDGIEAAMHLRQWGKQPVVTWLGRGSARAGRRLASLAARARGRRAPSPSAMPSQWDLAIDALLGLGSTRPLEGTMADWAVAMGAAAAPVLAVDLPSGLDADTGAGHAVTGDPHLEPVDA